MMKNRSWSLILGMALLVSSFPKAALAYPFRMRVSPNSGIHRTIVTPTIRVGGSYDSDRYNSYYGNPRRGNYYSRERIIIQRDNRGYCYNCRYRGRSYPSRYYRGYNRPYYPGGRYDSFRYHNRTGW